MKLSLTRWLLWIYPASWRERYADEFIALLEDCSLRWTDLIDVFINGVDARLSPLFNGKTRLMKPGTVSLIAIIGPILSVLMILFGLFGGMDEESSEFWLVVSPITLGAVVLVLNRLMMGTHDPINDGLRRYALYAGLIGSLALPIQIAAAFVFWVLGIPQYPFLSLLFLLNSSLLGVWLVLVGLMGGSSGHIPDLLALVGMCSGISWIAIMFGAIAGILNPGIVQNWYFALGINIMCFVLLFPIWLLWTSGLIFAFHRNGFPDNVAV